MKKIILIQTLMLSLLITSCGGPSSSNSISDSTYNPSDNSSSFTTDGNEQIEDANIGDYFDDVLILYQPDANTQNDRFIDGISNTDVEFNELLDRQISMLADDILNRLVGVYGTGYGSIEEVIELKDKEGISPEYQSIPASYVAKNAFATYDELEGGYLYSDGSVADGTNVNLTAVASWGYATEKNSGTILFNKDNTNLDVIVNNFAFQDTILGKNTVVNPRGLDNEFLGFYTGTNILYLNPWNWTLGNEYQHSDFDAFIEQYSNNYKDNLRMALSSLLLTGEYDINNSYDFNQTTYDDNLSNIGHIGLLSYDKQVIKDFIKDVIIGKDLIDADNEALRLLEENFDLTNFTGIEPDSEKLLNMTEEEFATLDIMHTYKAYDLIIDAVVEQTASNTFDGNAPIYATMPRLKSMRICWDEIEEQLNNIKIYSIILLPKDNVKLNLAVISFETSTYNKDFYSKVNANFVSDGTIYTTSKKVNNNSFSINNEDFDVYEFPTWNTHNYVEPEGITTFNNPYSLEQSDNITTLVNFDCGNNYLEISFEYYQDYKNTIPYIGIPELTLKIDDLEFSHE